MGRIKIEKKQGEQVGRFLFRFLLLSLPLYIILWLNLDFFAIQVAVVEQVGAVLRGLGFDVSTSQYLVKGEGFVLEVIEECTGWRDMLAFAALVLATEKKGKLQALALTPVIYVVNLLRLVATFIIGLFLPQFVGLAHNFLFQVFMLAFVFGLWYFGFVRR